MKTSETRMPKVCGMDVELGNFILGVDRVLGSGAEASRALLREVDGYPGTKANRWQAQAWNGRGWASATPDLNRQDWGRKFLSNGACAYIDLDHLEVATSETLSAFDQVACFHALLRVARKAQDAANAKLPAGQRMQVLVNNTDGTGNSYGSHVNMLLSRPAWNNIFDRKIHYQLYLAAFQASSIVFTGQGKVGSENGAPVARYQLSQRADYFETLSGPQTTVHRPLVNTRDEPLCGLGRGTGCFGESDDKARLHVIFYDSTLCHVSTLLKLGSLQIILAMIEAGEVDPRLILDDPLDAVLGWSHDPTLRARARLVDGTEITAAELQARFVECARAFVDRGGCEGVVPRAGEIVTLWEDTVSRLLARDLDPLVSRLDWVLKMSILERAIAQRPNLTWSSPQIKHLDHLYSSLDLDEGLYWTYERAGLVERVVPDERVTTLVDHPPECTRAWTRGMLLRHAGAAGVEDANWDWVRVDTVGRGGWRMPRTIHLSDPLQWTERQAIDVFDDRADLSEIADRLDRMALGAEGSTTRRSSYGTA